MSQVLGECPALLAYFWHRAAGTTFDIGEETARVGRVWGSESHSGHEWKRAYTQIVRGFHFRDLRRKEAATILGWRYPLPYDFYDRASATEEAVAELLRPENNYCAIEDRSGRLIGFFCLGPDAQVPGWEYDSAFLDLGMGLAPWLTGQGIGGDCLQAILRHLRIEESQQASARQWPRGTNARFVSVKQNSAEVLLITFPQSGDPVPDISPAKVRFSDNQVWEFSSVFNKNCDWSPVRK